MDQKDLELVISHALTVSLRKYKKDQTIKVVFRSEESYSLKYSYCNSINGDIVEKSVTSSEFKMMYCAHEFKNTIRKELYNIYRGKIAQWLKDCGNVLSGNVTHVCAEGVSFSLYEYSLSLVSGSTAFIPSNLMIPGENQEIGTHTSGYVKGFFLDQDTLACTFTLSRKCNNFVKELFNKHIPEISSGLMEIVDIARLPGLRSKVSIRATAPDKDMVLNKKAVSACIGFQGKKVAYIANALNKEKVDVLQWYDDPVKYSVLSLCMEQYYFYVFEEACNMIFIYVYCEYVKQCIGTKGSNVFLSSILGKHKIHIIGLKKEAVSLLNQDQIHTIYQSKYSLDSISVHTLHTLLNVDLQIAGKIIDEYNK